MHRSRVVYWLLCFALLFGVLGGLAGDQVILATQEDNNGSLRLPPSQEEEPPIEEKLELRSSYPVLPGKAGDGFDFEVELVWQSDEFRIFELATTTPPKWNASIIGGYPEKEIPAIGLEPGQEKYPEKVTVRFAPLIGELPEPGEYVVILEASSGDIMETIELKAVVTALYRYYFITGTGRLNTEVTAGKDNHLSIKIGNTGTAVIDKIDLLSTKPSGWTITFNPDRVESLEPGLAQEVDVIIKPPRETIVGDYLITMQAISRDLSPREIELRVTVLTPTIWGWVGIVIVLVVIAGLGVLFRQLGRR